MSIKPEEKPRDDEDELDELPPIDGDGGDGEDPEAGPEDLDEEIDDGGDPMDDSTGEDDPVDELEGSETETVETESSWLNDADEDDALDVGAPDALGEERESGALLEGAEETDVGVEDLAFGSEDESIVADAGEEGFLEEEEALREEDLPRLDSGDDAEMDDADLGDALPDDDAAEETLPPWDDRAWDRVEGAAGGLADPIAAVSSVACAGSAVLVAGEGLAQIDAAGKVTALEALGLRGGAPSAIATDASDAAVIVLSTPRAGVLVSRDGGKSFVEANDWRACVAREDAGREAAGAALGSLVMCGADLWGRTRMGALVWSGDRGATWTRANGAPARVDAIAIDAVTSELVAIARADAGTCIEVRGTAGRVAVTPCGPLPPAPVMALAANGGRVAVALAGRGAFRTNDAGGWSRLEGTASLTAIAYGPSGTLVVALCSEGEGRAWIVEARGHDGPARIVAELGDAPTTHEDESDARVRALAWDESRGVMWAAGAFGLVALRPARR